MARLMSATVLEAEKRLPYAPADLCRMVGDVRAYPRFIPWLKQLVVTKEEPRTGGGWEGAADAVVGWKAITERFSSHVRCEPEKGEVDVRLIKGPLKTLDNRWRFTPDGEGGALVKFWIAYEFKNPLLHAAVSANRARVSAYIMHAFESEAARRLG
jgi:coenzyme Q-binding protein COQ10